MDSYLIKGILIGLLLGMPVGAIGMMTIQRTLTHGFRAGLMTGLGSSVADCLYACIGAFGLTLISDFLLKYQTIVHILGGTLVVFMGIRLLILNAEPDTAQKQVGGGIKLFLSSFAIGITNPAAFLTFLFAFSYFGVSGQSGLMNSIQLVAGVFIGTYIWWGVLSAAVCIIKRKTETQRFCHLNRISGTILIFFGVAVYIKTLLL